MKIFFRCCALFSLLGGGAQAADHDQFCAELVRAERDFCADVAKVGISDAFSAHMADECFLPGSLELTRREFDTRVQAARKQAGVNPHPGANPDVRLVWTPAKVDVSSDGTLGYTWGRYDLSAPNETGKQVVTAAVYLTIWKRQPNGAWKFVYDGGPELPKDPGALQRFFARPDFPHPPIYAP